MMARFGDAEHTRHSSNREISVVRADGLEGRDSTAPVSRANQAAAQERISRSTRSCLFSRRSRPSSSRSITDRSLTFSSSPGRPSCTQPSPARPGWALQTAQTLGPNPRDRNQHEPNQPSAGETQATKADDYDASGRPPAKAGKAPPKRVNFSSRVGSLQRFSGACAEALPPSDTTIQEASTTGRRGRSEATITVS